MKTVKMPNGSTALVDDATMAYLDSKAPAPTASTLASLLSRVRRVRVMRGGTAGGRPLGTEVLAESTDRAVIEALVEHLRVLDGGCGHCMCHGDPALMLFAEDDSEAAVIGIHHGYGIRWNAWKDDARLVDGERVLEWLRDLGVDYPLAAYREAERDRALQATQADRWQAAMPACLAPFAERIFEDGVAFDHSALTPVLEAALPEVRDRILALFGWYGRGAGPWSGFPSYETVPERLLLAMPLPALLAAIRVEKLTEHELEGAARLFGGWDFRTKRGGDLRHLTSADRQRLLDHVIRSGDAGDSDRRIRAEKAFSPA
jgi:hypothetical protein